jgi:hypothetical protein
MMKKYLAILLALMLIPASALAADVKISALPEATTMAASDLFVIVDVGTNTTKKITATNFFANIPAPFTFNTGGDSYIQFELKSERVEDICRNVGVIYKSGSQPAINSLVCHDEEGYLFTADSVFRGSLLCRGKRRVNPQA